MSEGKIQIADAGAPALVVNPKGASPIVVVCEHASKYIPHCLDHLGLSKQDRVAHIAWDIGAEPVARRLAELLDAPLVLQRYSRLVYDCNRPPSSPGAMPEMSELTEIPGNARLSEEQRRARTDQIYRPFHATVSDVVNARRQAGVTPVLVTIHSFTPTFKGKVRLLDLGVLHDNDARLADAMLEVAQHGTGYSTRRNDPYGPEDGVTHTLNLHRGNDELLNVMLEVRNDLIADEPGQDEWAGRLAVLLKQALRSIDNHTADQVLASSS